MKLFLASCLSEIREFKVIRDIQGRIIFSSFLSHKPLRCESKEILEGDISFFFHTQISLKVLFFLLFIE